MTTRNVYVNPSASSYTLPPSSLPPAREISSFHSTLPSYTATPLTPLPSIARTLKIGTLLLKDERTRFSLPSFKPLGIAYAIRQALIAELSERLPAPISPTISLPDLAAAAKAEQITLITATDGKLGRILAKLGKFFGVESINTRIFVSDELEDGVKEGIRAEGAEVIVVQGDFETAVREAWLHSVATDGVLVNIDAEENYEDIPKWIVEGYSTIFYEISTQLPTPLDLIIVPVGIGGLAQAAVTHYKQSLPNKTRILTVEPEVAASLHRSLIAGDRVTLEESKDDKTILKHLAYGTVAEAAWAVLEKGVDTSVTVSDEAVLEAVRELEGEGLEVGTCGGAVLAALKSALGVEELGLNDSSTVVLICTDGKLD